MNDTFTRAAAADAAAEELRRLREQVAQQTALAELCRRISETMELAPLLGLLGEEVRTAKVFDGFLVTLPEQDGQHLVCRHIELPEEFKAVEAAYRDLKLPLDRSNANGQAYLDKAVAFVDAGSISAQPELIRDRFQRWRISELAVLPLARAGRVEGTLFGFVQRGRVDRARLAALDERLALFAAPVRKALHLADVRKLDAEVRAAAAERGRFLALVRQVTALTDLEQLYDVIAREILDWLPFDVCSVTIREGEALRVKKHIARQPRHEALARALDGFCADNPFRLEVSEGALAATFLNNRQVYFADVMQLLHLPMSAKDRRIIEIMGTPRSLLYVPIRRDGQPLGMLCLFTVTEPLQPTESDLNLLGSLCEVIGTAVGNADLYSTVARQQEQLRQAEAAKLEALLQAKEAAEASAAAKSAFVANTSHEIRTPLTAIIGFAESLVESSVPDSYAQQWAGIILRNSRHLLGLINDILDVSKMEAGRITLECLEVAPLELVAELEQTVAMLAQGKDLAFRVERRFPLPARMVADPTRLRQVLFNLLNNAIKFTDHGEVGLSVSFDGEAGRVQFTVTDTGIGIDQAAQARLFQPFTQADVSTSRRYGGTGLGLHIARSLVTLMGGELWVRSRPGEGSCFGFSVPVGIAEPELVHRLPQRGPEAPIERLGLTRLAGTVLLADDSADNRQLVSMYVNATGAMITAVVNGEEAVSEALTRPYDLVLLDVQMPVMSGVEAVRTLRDLNYAGPIYALTANVSAQDLSEYARAGFDGHLAKPIDRRAFLQLLRERLPGAEGLMAEIDLSALEREFQRRLPDYLRRIEAGFDRDDWVGVAREAHRLKGTAGSLGRMDVTAAAATVETLAKRRMVSPVEHEALVRAMAALRGAALATSPAPARLTT